MTSRPNPYVGPRSFSTEERLFGRDREVTELVDLILAERIVLLHSPSGAGKTSLVQAGLIPALRQRGFNVRPVMRTGLEPPRDNGFSFSAANRHILSCLISVQEGLPPEKRWSLKDLATVRFEEYLGGTADDELLIFDQFEEVLVVDPVNRQTKEEFFAQVGSALRNKNRSALFVIREDYVAPLDPYLRPIPTRLKNTYRLDLLSVEAALAAMQKPAAAEGVTFEDDAAKKLADDLRRVQVQLPDGTTAAQFGPYVEPVQLQVVCRRLWGSVEESDRIRAADVAAVANVDNALADYYAESTSTIAKDTGVSEQAIRDWVEQRLISKQGIRGQVLQGHDESEGLKNSAVWRLVDTHLVRSEKRNGATWFELAHDRLIQPVKADNAAWRDAHLSPLQKRAALWASQSRPSSLLLKDEELRDAEKWAEKQTSLAEAERSFLESSAAAQKIADRQRRQQRFIRILAVVSTIVGIIAIAAALYAINQFRTASAREFAASSERVVQSNHALGLALARKSLEVKNTAEGKEALHLAVQFAAGPAFQGHTDTVNSISFRPDGTQMVTASDDNTVKLWRVAAEPDDTELVRFGDRALSAVFSADGRRIAVAGADGVIKVIDAVSTANVLTFPASTSAATTVAFSPDGKMLASGGDDNRAVIWGPLPSSLSGTSEFRTVVQSVGTGFHIRSVAFDGPNRIMTADTGGNVIVWDVGSGKQVAELKGHKGPVNSIAVDLKRGLIATGGDDGTVRLWSSGSYAPGNKFEVAKDVSRVAFSPDDKALAAVSFLDGTTKVWGLDSRTETVHLPAVKPVNQEKLRAVSFLPPGHDRLAVAADSSVRLYDLDLQRLDGRAAELLRKLPKISAEDCERFLHEPRCNASR